jgi:hypothetical protein
MRIPRPLGITNLVKIGDKEAVYERLSRKFLQGEFPFRSVGISLVDFSIQWRIPMKSLQKVLREGLQEESLLSGAGMKDKLDNLRFRLLDSTIYQHGTSQFKVHRLITYLEDHIYPSTSPDPSLIRELNVALANSHKGTDSVSKILQLLNDALGSQEHVSDGQTLDRDEILKIIGEQEPDMGSMLREVEGTPSLKPAGKAGGVSLVPLKKLDGDYNRAKDLQEFPSPEEFTSLPV